MAKLKGLSHGVLILASLSVAALAKGPSAALGQMSSIEMGTAQGDIAVYGDNIYIVGISDVPGQAFL